MGKALRPAVYEKQKYATRVCIIRHRGFPDRHRQRWFWAQHFTIVGFHLEKTERIPLLSTCVVEPKHSYSIREIELQRHNFRNNTRNKYSLDDLGSIVLTTLDLTKDYHNIWVYK